MAVPVRDDSPRRRWMDGRAIDGVMAARNRQLLQAAEVELVERAGRVFTLRRLPDVPAPDPRLEPRQILPRGDSFRPIA